jgi:hypothetical protein
MILLTIEVKTVLRICRLSCRPLFHRQGIPLSLLHTSLVHDLLAFLDLNVLLALEASAFHYIPPMLM